MQIMLLFFLWSVLLRPVFTTTAQPPVIPGNAAVAPKTRAPETHGSVLAASPTSLNQKTPIAASGVEPKLIPMVTLNAEDNAVLAFISGANADPLFATWGSTNACPVGTYNSPWTGVYCDGNGNVNEIDIIPKAQTGSGTLSFMSLKSLAFMQYLFIMNTFFTGDVDLTQLPPTMEEIYLTYSQFSGTLNFASIPPTMYYIVLYFCAFSGPVDLSTVPTTLTHLELSGNQLTGNVDLRNFVAGAVVSVDGNQFTTVQCNADAATSLHLDLFSNPWRCAGFPSVLLPLMGTCVTSTPTLSNTVTKTDTKTLSVTVTKTVTVSMAVTDSITTSDSMIPIPISTGVCTGVCPLASFATPNGCPCTTFIVNLSNTTADTTFTLNANQSVIFGGVAELVFLTVFTGCGSSITYNSGSQTTVKKGLTFNCPNVNVDGAITLVSPSQLIFQYGTFFLNEFGSIVIQFGSLLLITSGRMVCNYGHVSGQGCLQMTNDEDESSFCVYGCLIVGKKGSSKRLPANLPAPITLSCGDTVGTATIFGTMNINMSPSCTVSGSSFSFMATNITIESTGALYLGNVTTQSLPITATSSFVWASGGRLSVEMISQPPVKSIIALVRYPISGANCVLPLNSYELLASGFTFSTSSLSSLSAMADNAGSCLIQILTLSATTTTTQSNAIVITQSGPTATANNDPQSSQSGSSNSMGLIGLAGLVIIPIIVVAGILGWKYARRSATTDNFDPEMPDIASYEPDRRQDRTQGPTPYVDEYA